MSLIPLVKVSTLVRTGAPLLWNVRDEYGNLLLSRGHILETDLIVAKLLERGVFVDSEEIAKAARESTAGTAPPTFFDRFARLEAQMHSLLTDPHQPQFLKNIEETVHGIVKMAEQHTDPLIFSVIRPQDRKLATYGVRHSVHAASVCALLLRKLDWPLEKRLSLIGAALTMNLSMVNLQGQLAYSGAGLSLEQRREVNLHPTGSAELLEKLGVTDALWLQTVVEHHEQPDGKGYPRAVHPCETAQFLRLVDIFTAKHSPRKGRLSMPAKQAAQALYKESNGHAVASMLIKEFGIFPPGCLVSLANGETGVVVRRGDQAATPHVAVLMNREGEPSQARRVRDTSNPLYAVRGTVEDSVVRVPMHAENFYGPLGG